MVTKGRRYNKLSKKSQIGGGKLNVASLAKSVSGKASNSLASVNAAPPPPGAPQGGVPGAPGAPQGVAGAAPQGMGGAADDLEMKINQRNQRLKPGVEQTPQDIRSKAMEMAREKFKAHNDKLAQERQIKAEFMKVKIEREKNKTNFWNGSVTPILKVFLEYTLGYVIILLFIWAIGYIYKRNRELDGRAPLFRNRTKNSKQAKYRFLNPMKNYDKYSIGRRGAFVGRTDQVINYDPSNSYGVDYSSIAINTIQPDKIQWVIDPTKGFGFNLLPQKLMQSLQNMKEKLTINIPWTNNGWYRIPDCANATYSDGSSASDILQDRGGVCSLSVGSLPLYTNRLRPANTNGGYKGIDKYASYEEPLCK